jgi:lipoate-protein ligase A
LTPREILVQHDQTRDPVRNLAREEELFHQVESRASPEVARFWIDSECLVRGKVRNPRYGWFNQELAEELGVPVLQRSTGGGVVYHDPGNLNWSLFLKSSGDLLSPKAMFSLASGYVIEALRSLGVQARFSPPNRIDVSGRKVSGMAAKSTVRTMLVHGTLLLNSDLGKLNQLCISPAGCPPVSNLSEWVRDIDAVKVVGAFQSVLEGSGFRVRMTRVRP